MNTQRDELAMELFIADNFKQPREQSIKDWEWYKTAGNYQGRVEGYKDMADGLIAAGYSKPRTITTVEELNALPFETVIRDAEGHVLERWGHDPANVWVTVMVRAFIPRGDVALPATVLYEPTA